MTTKGINMLIAGSVFCPESVKTNIEHYIDCGNEEGLNYYYKYFQICENWDRLIEVVEKIEATQTEKDGKFGVYICSNSCTIEGTKHGGYYNQHYAETKILAVVEAVVTFIKWYNETKKIQGVEPHSRQNVEAVLNRRVT